MNLQGIVGPPGASIADGSPSNFRQGRLQDLIVSELHGRYYEQAFRGNVFHGCNQAAQALSVGLNTTYTGICLSNPAGAGVNLVLLKISLALTAAPAAADPIMLAVGFNAAGVTSHTTPLSPLSTKLGSGLTPVGKLDSACTLPTAPTYAMPLMGGFTAAAFPSTGPSVPDMEGMFVLPPGSYALIAATSAASIFGGIAWEEVPL